MKKILFNLSILLLFPLFVMSQSSIVGAWMTEIPNPEGVIIPVKLVISEDGSYTVDFGNDGTVEINGKYELNGDQITIWDVAGEMACLDAGKAVYKFAVDAEAFAMTRVTDPCEGRGGPEGKMAFRRK